MRRKVYLNNYHNSLEKKLLDNFGAILIFAISLPILLTISILIYLFDGLPILYKQKRTGLNGQSFWVIKFRSMVVNADEKKAKLMSLNEVEGPVFKIKDDPRFTGLGKLLSKTGLDELPQIMNVIKGEMSIVGPRPLPVEESERLTKLDKTRLVVKPGITSTWVIKGSHEMPFKKWMELDREYIEKATLTTDLEVIVRTMILIGNFVLKL